MTTGTPERPGVLEVVLGADTSGAQVALARAESAALRLGLRASQRHVHRLEQDLATAVGLLRDLAEADRMDDLVSITDPYRFGWWSGIEQADARAAGVLKEDTQEAGQ